MPDLEFAHAVLVLDCDPVDDAPILDLRIRKGVRRNGVRLAVASARPGALDPNAETVLRYAPGSGEALLVGLDAALGGDDGNLGGAATAAGSNASAVRELGEFLSGAGADVVILYGERLLTGPRGAEAATALLNLAARLGLAGRDGAGLLEIPSSANGRGIREAGFAPAHGPGYAALEPAADDAGDDAACSTCCTPTRCARSRDRAAWEAALGKAQTVIAHASALTDTVREHADVVFPAEAYAEKEGTLVHPDGRVQRLRPAIGRPGRLGSGVRAGWQVIAEVSRRAGFDLGVRAGPMASAQLFDAVPFFAGLTLDAIGARGVRWPASEAAGALGAEPWELAELERPAAHGRRRERRRCDWAPGARCGRRPRSTSRPRCASCARARSSSSRPSTPTGSACATATRSRSARERHARARRRAAARRGAERLGLPRRGHATSSPPTCSTEPLVQRPPRSARDRSAPRSGAGA